MHLTAISCYICICLRFHVLSRIEKEEGGPQFKILAVVIGIWLNVIDFWGVSRVMTSVCWLGLGFGFCLGLLGLVWCGYFWVQLSSAVMKWFWWLGIGVLGIEGFFVWNLFEWIDLVHVSSEDWGVSDCIGLSINGDVWGVDWDMGFEVVFDYQSITMVMWVSYGFSFFDDMGWLMHANCLWYGWTCFSLNLGFC